MCGGRARACLVIWYRLLLLLYGRINKMVARDDVAEAVGRRL
jgi:hypothetical protein